MQLIDIRKSLTDSVFDTKWRVYLSNNGDVEKERKGKAERSDNK